MKPSHMLRTAFFATVASAALSTAAFAQIQPMQYNGITYVTGGIGLEEREALEAQSGQYNLKILNSGLQGHFVGEAMLSIRSSNGTEVLNVMSGPEFYANLPAGRYSITATHNGEPKSRQVTIGKSQTRIGFAWAAPIEDTITDSHRAGDMLVAPYNRTTPMSQDY